MAKKTSENETNSSVSLEYFQKMQNLQSSTGLPMAPMEPEIGPEIKRDDMIWEDQKLLHYLDAIEYGVIPEE